ncbi:hypothetical protein DD238_002477 [Peronospora effusa]|uniref:Uncharacterized protein n=1 Tax=Peronospora effusa TaxID=542832 RepID=A0A3M6VS18_9STRA|nr:hypothetical protein DD238_002477 [Peronospora effusa]
MLSRQADDTINAVKKDTSDMTIDWVLDSASVGHVCTNKEILMNLQFNDGPMVFDWEGNASQYTEQIGEVELRVRNETPPSCSEFPEQCKKTWAHNLSHLSLRR